MQNFPNDMLNKIRSTLEEEKLALNKRIEELSAQDPFSDPNRLDDNAASDGEANEESSHDRFSALVHELKDKVSNIDDALFRIADGTYGVCINCAKEIDIERLTVIPTASLCLDCEQAKKEKVIVS